MCLLPANIKGKKVVVSPLNWGLGHATRLIPIVETLIANGNEVILAGEKPSIDILAQRFDACKVIVFEDKPFKFDENFFSIAGQINFVKTLRQRIKADRQSAESIAQETGAAVIVSDNRYGFYSPSTYNIIVTHQLRPLSPYGKIANKVAARIAKRLLKPFDCIWLPDDERVELAGKLAWPAYEKVKPVGVLSRFCNWETPVCDEFFDVGVIISGPEPARSKLEKRIVNYFSEVPVKSIVAGGKYGPDFKVGNMTYKGWATDNDLKKIIYCSNKIVVRSGYSTIMDLWCAGKNAVLIPTPRQTEQEYLAKYLSKKYPQRFTFLPEDELEKIPYDVWSVGIN